MKKFITIFFGVCVFGVCAYYLYTLFASQFFPQKLDGTYYFCEAVVDAEKSMKKEYEEYFNYNFYGVVVKIEGDYILVRNSVFDSEDYIKCELVKEGDVYSLIDESEQLPQFKVKYEKGVLNMVASQDSETATLIFKKNKPTKAYQYKVSKTSSNGNITQSWISNIENSFLNINNDKLTFYKTCYYESGDTYEEIIEYRIKLISDNSYELIYNDLSIDVLRVSTITIYDDEIRLDFASSGEKGTVIYKKIVF